MSKMHFSRSAVISVYFHNPVPAICLEARLDFEEGECTLPHAGDARAQTRQPKRAVLVTIHTDHIAKSAACSKYAGGFSPLRARPYTDHLAVARLPLTNRGTVSSG